jgi:hypothetical protein
MYDCRCCLFWNNHNTNYCIGMYNMIDAVFGRSTRIHTNSCFVVLFYRNNTISPHAPLPCNALLWLYYYIIIILYKRFYRVYNYASSAYLYVFEIRVTGEGVQKYNNVLVIMSDNHCGRPNGAHRTYRYP